MIKTDIDIKDDLYAWVALCPVAGLISGRVYKDQRPLNSDKEDIVISILSGSGKQMQEVTANVNIFVPDIRRGNDMIEDTARLKVLCAQAASDLDYAHFGDRIFELEHQRVYEVNGLEWHAINNRIRVRYNNES